MSKIAIAGTKGGTGKTTVATNFAAKILQEGNDNLLLIDTDSNHNSLSKWAEHREGNEDLNSILCIEKSGRSIGETINRLSEKYKDIVIDTAGADSDELRYVMEAVDVVIFTVQASQFDIWTLQDLDILTNKAKNFNPTLKAFLLPTRVATNPNIKEIDELEELAQEIESIELCDTPIRERIAYRKGARNGGSIFELTTQDPKATKEMNEIFNKIYYGKK